MSGQPTLMSSGYGKLPFWGFLEFCDIWWGPDVSDGFMFFYLTGSILCWGVCLEIDLCLLELQLLGVQTDVVLVCGIEHLRLGWAPAPLNHSYSHPIRDASIDLVDFVLKYYWDSTTPNGKHMNWYCPKGVLNVVHNKLDWWSSSTCQ